MVVIRTYTNIVDAEVARAELEAAGIEAFVLSDDAGGMLPSLQIAAGVRLAVRDEDAEKALAYLDAVAEETAEDNADSG